MEFDAVQAAASAKLLPFVLFSIGVIALFFVYRRSLLKLKQRDRSNDQSLRARAHEAQGRIGEITAREWLRRHQRALRVDRSGAWPPPQVLAALSRISGYQRQRMGG
jgi:hypothetical protein